MSMCNNSIANLSNSLSVTLMDTLDEYTGIAFYDANVAKIQYK